MKAKLLGIAPTIKSFTTSHGHRKTKQYLGEYVQRITSPWKTDHGQDTVTCGDTLITTVTTKKVATPKQIG